MVTLHLQSGSGEQTGNRASRPTPSNLLPWEVPNTPQTDQELWLTVQTNKIVHREQLTFKPQYHLSIHPSIKPSFHTHQSLCPLFSIFTDICLSSLMMSVGYMTWSHFTWGWCSLRKLDLSYGHTGPRSYVRPTSPFVWPIPTTGQSLNTNFLFSSQFFSSHKKWGTQTRAAVGDPDSPN